MKRTLKSVFIAIFALTAVVFAALGLAACQNEAKVTNLIIENAKVDFIVGDEFTLGEDCVIYAVYDDGSKVDVTTEAELRKETGFDMSVSDEYQITVSYGGKKEVYSIFVSSYDNVLKRIQLNTANVKTQYALGEPLSLDGLIVVATYENAQGRQIVFNYTSTKNFTVAVTASDGTQIGSAFMELGNYTVTVSQGLIKASYPVIVQGISIATVESAINIGKIFASEVVSGTQEGQFSLHAGAYEVEHSYEYKYGDNYTYVNDKSNAAVKDEYHYSILDGEIFCAKYTDDVLAPNGLLVEEMMDGPNNILWYSFMNVYGIENTLIELYKGAKNCTNNDLVETVNEGNRTYSFTFSGLVNFTSRPDYYETTVTFKLGEKYNVESAEYTQKYWENNETAIGASWYVPSFITDENGKTVPNIEYSKAVRVTVNQTAGERTETNPYGKTTFTVTSYDLTYNGQKLEDPNATIKCSMANPKLEITIDNVQPSTANFTSDVIMFSYEGNRGGYQNSVGVPVGPSKGFQAYRSNSNSNVINVLLRGGGTWKLFIKTAALEKTVTFEVTGEAPVEIDPYIRNDASGRFYAGDSKTIAIVGDVYFYGNVSMGLDASQTAEITSANASSASVQKITLGDVDCFKFTATAAGVYTVKVASSANASVFCVFTFTVSEEPDYESLLNGKYTVTTMEGYIYDFTFTLESADNVSGTLLVVQTPTDDGGNPIPDNAKSQAFKYSVNRSSMEVVLVGDEGNTLGVELSVNAEGKLVLNDVHENIYPLTPVTE